jgi:hypothetical protein
MRIKPVSEKEIIIETKRGLALDIFDTESYSAIVTTPLTKRRKIVIDVAGEIWIDGEKIKSKEA